MEQTVKVKFENAPTQFDEISNRVDAILDGNASVDKIGMGYYIKQKFVELEGKLKERDIAIENLYLKIDNDLAYLQERLKK